MDASMRRDITDDGARVGAGSAKVSATQAPGKGLILLVIPARSSSTAKLVKLG
jgi:hypothetical protein